MIPSIFNFRFFHFEDKEIYKVLQLCSNFPDEDFQRVFIKSVYKQTDRKRGTIYKKIIKKAKRFNFW